MCVKSATNLGDASSKEEYAPSTETSATSEPKCRLLCSPQNLPETKLPKTEEYRETKPDIRRELKDYFWKQKYKKKPRRRNRER